MLDILSRKQSKNKGGYLLGVITPTKLMWTLSNMGLKLGGSMLVTLSIFHAYRQGSSIPYIELIYGSSWDYVSCHPSPS